MQTIQQKAAAELQSAKDPQQADKVKANAESDMIAAVERSGLQVPEFNHIVERMASDTEVRSRVAAKLQERSGSKPGAKPEIPAADAARTDAFTEVANEPPSDASRAAAFVWVSRQRSCSRISAATRS